MPSDVSDRSYLDHRTDQIDHDLDHRIDEIDHDLDHRMNMSGISWSRSSDRQIRYRSPSRSSTSWPAVMRCAGSVQYRPQQNQRHALYRLFMQILRLPRGNVGYIIQIIRNIFALNGLDHEVQYLCTRRTSSDGKTWRKKKKKLNMNHHRQEKYQQWEEQQAKKCCKHCKPKAKRSLKKKLEEDAQAQAEEEEKRGQNNKE